MTNNKTLSQESSRTSSPPVSPVSIPSVLVEAEAELSALVKEFGYFITACPEHRQALEIMRDRHMAVLDRLAMCRRQLVEPVQVDLLPVRWKCGAVYVEKTPHGYCIVSERGTVWNILGGWDSAPQPSSRDTDWYKEHNLSNLQAALRAAQAANAAEGDTYA